MKTSTHSKSLESGSDAANRAAGNDDYLKLVLRFRLRPIRTKADHRIALGILAELSPRGTIGKLSDGERDYLDALAQFVADYEAIHVTPKIGNATPLEMLKHLMEQHGMTSANLGDVLGSRPVATMILKSQRGMSKSHIRALAAHFSVSPAVFL